MDDEGEKFLSSPPSVSSVPMGTSLQGDASRVHPSLSFFHPLGNRMKKGGGGRPGLGLGAKTTILMKVLKFYIILIRVIRRFI